MIVLELTDRQAQIVRHTIASELEAELEKIEADEADIEEMESLIDLIDNGGSDI